MLYSIIHRIKFFVIISIPLWWSWRVYEIRRSKLLVCCWIRDWRYRRKHPVSGPTEVVEDLEF